MQHWGNVNPDNKIAVDPLVKDKPVSPVSSVEAILTAEDSKDVKNTEEILYLADENDIGTQPERREDDNGLINFMAWI